MKLLSRALLVGGFISSLWQCGELSAQTPVKPVRCNSDTDPVILERHKNSELYNLFDTKCDGRPDLAAYNAYLDAKNPLAAHDAERRRRAGLPPLNPTDVPAPPSPSTEVGGWHSYPILRDAFEDVAVFGRPKDVKLASGASFGWTHDAAGSNTSWSAKGVAGYPVVWQSPINPEPRAPFDPYLVGLALTPTVNFQRVTASSPKLAKSRVDILTLGGAAEFAVGHMLDATTTHYFRTRAAAVGTFEGDFHSWSEAFEYQPITNWGDGRIPNIGSPNALGLLPATYQINAILRSQYVGRTATTSDPLFLNRYHVLRGGPVLALSVIPLQGSASPVSKLLQRLNFTASYSWLQNFENAKSYSHYIGALGFALDENGNVGVKLSYEGGKSRKPVSL